MGEVEIIYTLAYTQEQQSTAPAYYELYVSDPREPARKNRFMSSDVDLEGIIAITRLPTAVRKELRARRRDLKLGEKTTVHYKIAWPPIPKPKVAS
ncbi:MAG: hypothetical protein NTY99_00330 [DPANN group archaeon]|nr:hypothetical protein [DPANN group archaeon]